MSINVRARVLRGAAIPRAIIGGVRADGGNVAEILAALNVSVASLKSDVKAQVDGVQKVVADFRAENDAALKGKADGLVTAKVDRINTEVGEATAGLKAAYADIAKITAEIDSLNAKVAAGVEGGASNGGNRDHRLANPGYGEYAKAFKQWFKKGTGEQNLRQLEVNASMSVGSDPDGGYTVLPEMEQAIDEVVKEISPMRSLATIRQIGTMEYKKLVNQHGMASGWVGETESRAATASSTLSELRFPVMEVYAMPAATQTLLDDSFLNIEQWIADEVQTEFAQKEGIAFITGDGSNKPSGILGAYTIITNGSYAWNKIGYVPTGAAGAYKTTDTPPIGGDVLVDTYHALKSMYRKNSTWIANRSTLGATRKLKDGQGNYLLNMVFRPEGFIEEILGRPAVEMPDMPDIAANSYSVALGDWKRAYLIVDRVGIRVTRDPYTSKPYVLFYTTKRVGGGVANFEALKLIKFASS